MGIVKCSISASLDGFVAGTNQRLEAPFGDTPFGDAFESRMHGWMFEQPDQHIEERDDITAAGAFIMGRNMFSPGRGDWDQEWTGWWGDDPPYHAPVFVLTHHPRDPVPMLGGTTFHFVTDGIESALAQAKEAAGDRDVAIAGGAATVNQYLKAGLLDELSIHVAPIVMGQGARLFEDLGGLQLTPVRISGNELVTHITYRIER